MENWLVDLTTKSSTDTSLLYANKISSKDHGKIKPNKSKSECQYFDLMHFKEGIGETNKIISSYEGCTWKVG